ncbi:TMEM175 family protein [Sphingomonas sp. GV3]|uniref:TMEM175 family protein n=1 Tax=Sphingomonas sp. GV3 TaxID=3040671 RepID=UPI00280ADCF9|nr:TMEM175 family protein [Sphingomonas sp. GV3]
MTAKTGVDWAHDESQLERLTFFSDAVFAIAMTLLIVEIHVPELPVLSERGLGIRLINLMPHYIGFLSSFLVIGRFWVAHHQLFGLLDRTSTRLLWTNTLFLLAVAFMPFPTAVLSTYVQLRVGVGFYCAWLTVLGLANLVLIRAAFAQGTLLKPGVSPELERQHLRGAMIPIFLGLLALVAGMISPLAVLVALTLGGPLIGAALRRKGSVSDAGQAPPATADQSRDQTA